MQNRSPIEFLVTRLEGVRSSGTSRWIARCPAHDDRTPSLTIRETADGTLLLHCFAGCGAADIVASIGLALRDLFPEPVAHHRPAQRRRRPPASEVLAAVSHALTVMTLADSTLMRGEMLTNDEYEAVDRALSVLADARNYAA